MGCGRGRGSESVLENQESPDSVLGVRRGSERAECVFVYHAEVSGTFTGPERKRPERGSFRQGDGERVNRSR